MSRPPVSLETQVRIAQAFINGGARYFDLVDWGLRVGYSGDGGMGCITIPESEGAPPPAAPEVADAVISVNEKAQLDDLRAKIESGDMTGVQEILAAANLKLVRTDGETNDAPSEEGTA